MDLGRTQNIAILEESAAAIRSGNGTSEPCSASDGKSKIAASNRISGMAAFFSRQTGGFAMLKKKRSYRRASAIKKILFICHGTSVSRDAIYCI